MVFNSIKKQLRPKKTWNPHKKNPDAYYKTVWLSKNLYDTIEKIAGVEKKSVMKISHLLLEHAIISYFNQKIDEEMNTRALMKADIIGYKRPGPFVKMMRDFLKEKGIANPRIDKGYPVL